MTAAPTVEACSRCGALLPLRSRGTRWLCAECFQRTRPAIESEPPTVANLLRSTALLMRRVWLPATLISAAVGLFPAALAAVSEPSLPLSFLLGFCSLLSVGAVLDLGAQAIENEDLVPAWRPAVARSLRRWRALSVARLRVLVSAGLAALLFVIPGIVVSLNYALVYPMVLRGKGSGFPLYSESTDRMRGHRLKLLLALVLLATTGLAVIVVAGVAAAALALGLVLGDESTSNLGVIRALSTFLGELLTVPFSLLIAALDAKLRPRAPSPASPAIEA